jgi:hypothetical protein
MIPGSGGPYGEGESQAASSQEVEQAKREQKAEAQPREKIRVGLAALAQKNLRARRLARKRFTLGADQGPHAGP